ncbi:hypothetical protein IRT45_32855 [Nocardia sp. BSTN01]|uniref:hypothetical protein n=1 Tax=Nocardia sp. BSTN01 TaxID=2783665 RepID=UPI00188E1AA6|nr:hypothetical protein [Nocardia sp. BSTN01]MBF5001913.1 hypothetical protein [Nocardia sp. BSTN01]
MTNESIKEFTRVTGKENLLFKVPEATVDAGYKLVTALIEFPQPGSSKCPTRERCWL